MRKTGLIALACALTFAACSKGPAGPPEKPPVVAEGRITLAKIGGRDLPIFTFGGRLDVKEHEFVAVRLMYSTTGDLHQKGELVSPVTREGKYEPRRNALLYITEKVKDAELEGYLATDDARIAFYWEIDFKAKDDPETVHTTRSVLYQTEHDDIAAADLAREIR